MTAFNTAGESEATLAEIRVGDAPSAPLRPRLTAITPGATLTIEWEDPLSNGCLTSQNSVINRDGSDLSPVIAPGLNIYTDDISAYAIGTKVTYMIKVVNVAGSSPLSVPLVVTVGQPPNAPTSLAISRRFSETSVEFQWADGSVIASNPATSTYHVFVDDGSGNVV